MEETLAFIEEAEGKETVDEKGIQFGAVTSDEDSLVTCSGNRDWRLFCGSQEDLVRLLNERDVILASFHPRERRRFNHR